MTAFGGQQTQPRTLHPVVQWKASCGEISSPAVTSGMTCAVRMALVRLDSEVCRLSCCISSGQRVRQQTAVVDAIQIHGTRKYTSSWRPHLGSID